MANIQNLSKHDISKEILEDFRKDFEEVIPKSYKIESKDKSRILTELEHEEIATKMKRHASIVAGIIASMIANVDKLKMPIEDIVDYMDAIDIKYLDIHGLDDLNKDFNDFLFYTQNMVNDWFVKSDNQEKFSNFMETAFFIFEPLEHLLNKPSESFSEWWFSLEW